MKKKTLFMLVVLALTFTSCKTFYVGDNSKKLEVGMTKEEVISVMGGGYEISHGSIDAEGNKLEVLEYNQGTVAVYCLEILNGRLVTWNKEWLPEPRRIEVKTTNVSKTAD